METKTAPPLKVALTEGLCISEPRITVNGVALTDAQAMTLRVATSDFAMELSAGGLGTDEHGKAMTAGYLERLGEIFKLMHNAEGVGPRSGPARP